MIAHHIKLARVGNPADTNTRGYLTATGLKAGYIDCWTSKEYSAGQFGLYVSLSYAKGYYHVKVWRNYAAAPSEKMVFDTYKNAIAQARQWAKGQ